eukprot:128477_1
MLCFLIVLIPSIFSDSLLTADQRNWLLGISRDNSSTTDKFPAVSTDQSQQLNLKNELFINETIKYHLPYHYANDVLFTNYNKTNIAEYNDCGDASFSTSHYIAYLAHRWNITKDLNTLNEIHNEISAFYILITCAERQGYMVRMLGKANDSAYKAYYSHFTSHYNCSDNSPTVDSSYIWLGHAERDQYIGGAMMLTVIWTHVYSNTNDNQNIIQQITEIRNMVYNISELIINDLYSSDFWIVNSIPDHDAPVNPTANFKCVWMRLAMSINPNKYVALFQQEYDDKFEESVLTLQMHISDIYHSAYFANNLCIIIVASLAYLENDTEKLISLFNALQYNAVNEGKYHLQATFSAWFLSVAEMYKNKMEKYHVTETNLNIARGILQGTLLDFPDNKWEKYMNQTTNPLYYPHYGNQMSKYALLPYDRPYDTFIWQRSPAILSGGSNDTIQQYQMIDFLLPYWIAKYVKIVM